MIIEKKTAATKKEKNILLTGVFGPFAQDDEYGSRKVNPMELYHNQVTRVQGPFSLRMFHRTFGLLMIEANIDAPCTILEFASLDRFIEEIKDGDYDVVGISSILPNIGKVEKMCLEIRRHLPNAEIVIGGHIASKENLGALIDADHICKGDGISWFREFLGQDADAPINHPAAISGFGVRIMGIQVPVRNTAGILIPSVGCPVGCNFCSTSALFGGKGNSVSFYKTGDELFDVLCQLEEKLDVNSFFVLDENFLLYKDRALRLLELMEEHDKSWSFYVFSSARVLRSYTIDQLMSIGISWLWLGLEGEKSKYTKLNNVDTVELVNELQSNGIRVLGSTIIGMEEHTPENIHDAIDYAVSHDTDFHQFMLYTPIPGTPLYQEHLEKGTLLPESECSDADTHGQEKFNFKHPNIKDGQENDYLLKAFTEDFRINGPSLGRIARTLLLGWKKHKDHPDKRVRTRVRFDSRGLNTIYAGAVWSMVKWYKNDKQMKMKMKLLLKDIYKAFGFIARVCAPAVGMFVHYTIKKEDKRLSAGWTYEPVMIYEKNALALELEQEKSSTEKVTIPQIELPVYDLSHGLNLCRERMEEIRINISAKQDKFKARISVINDRISEYYDQLKEDPSSIGGLHIEEQNSEHQNMESLRDQMLEMSNNARKELEQIREQVYEYYKLAGEEFDEIKEQMVEKREHARDQVQSIYDNMLEKCRQIQIQIDTRCENVQQKIEDIKDYIEKELNTDALS